MNPQAFVFTEKCTDDWHLGELTAVHGSEPYPVPKKVWDPTAFSAGFHLAYKKIHGRDWQLKMPESFPANAIVPREGKFATSPMRYGKDSHDHWLMDQVIRMATVERGLDPEHVHAVLLRVDFDLGYPQHCNCPIYACGFVCVRTGSREAASESFSLSLDFIQGEYDLRPQLEELMGLVELSCRRLVERRAEIKRRRELPDQLVEALSERLGLNLVVTLGPDDDPSKFFIMMSSIDEATVRHAMAQLKRIPAAVASPPDTR